jgi:hypothetical protein
MRPEARNPLTYDEHRELALEVQKTRARLLQLSNLVTDVYGPQSPTAFAFHKLTEAMERVAAEMRAQAEVDCPGRNPAEFYR